MGIVIIGAGLLSQLLVAYDLTRTPLIRFGVPTLLVAASAVLMFWIVNKPSAADFMIATEGEMKKVSWSSRKEIIGSTKVVIITTFILAGVLFGVDILFSFFFQKIGLFD
jgi:preprotein translocase subunit SecE